MKFILFLDNTEPEAKEEAVVNIEIKTTEETIEKKDEPAEAVEKEVILLSFCFDIVFTYILSKHLSLYFVYLVLTLY